MQALVKRYPKEGLWLEDVPMPQPGPNDVLIKVIKSSICGTDVHIWNWDEWAQKTIKVPLVIGHEFVGRVEKVGEFVQDFQAGMIVSGEGHIVCGHCRNCLGGREHFCKYTQGLGVHRDGAFAEYVLLPKTNVWRCDPNIPLEVLSCFDPLGNAVHTALTFNVLAEDVLITGAGPIGCMACAIAKKAGARNIVVTDLNPDRLALAKKMGATMVVNPQEQTLQEAMDALQMKEGFDVGFEMSGNAKAFHSMLSSMCHGGRIAILGLGIHGPDSMIDWDKVVFHGLTIQGIYGRKMYETWYQMTALIQSGLDITPVITHRFDYKDFAKGFELMRSGRSGKVILNWE